LNTVPGTLIHKTKLFFKRVKRKLFCKNWRFKDESAGKDRMLLDVVEVHFLSPVSITIRPVPIVSITKKYYKFNNVRWIRKSFLTRKACEHTHSTRTRGQLQHRRWGQMQQGQLHQQISFHSNLMDIWRLRWRFLYFSKNCRNLANNLKKNSRQLTIVSIGSIVTSVSSPVSSIAIVPIPGVSLSVGIGARLGRGRLISRSLSVVT